MDELLHERIAKRTHTETRYLHGHQYMNMERFREYHKEFQVALTRSDYHKIGEVVQDAIQISKDTMRIIRKRGAIAQCRSFIRDQSVRHESDRGQIHPPLKNVH